MKIKVGIIFGGETVEHEISIITAVQAMENINQEKYEIVPIYIAKDREWYTGEKLRNIETYKNLSEVKKYSKNIVLMSNKGKYILQSKVGFKTIIEEIDIAFPITHGTNVEDGVLQGYLQTIGIPYVGNDVSASVIGQDKVIMKEVWKNAGLPMSNYIWFFDVDYEEDEDKILEKIEKLEYPLIVKPATMGSSIGITICKDKEELNSAIENAIEYDKKIIVEEVVQNLKEVNIAVMGNTNYQKVSAIEEVYSKSDFLSYEDKYLGDGTKSSKTGNKTKGSYSKGMATADRKIPADIDKETKEEIEKIAKKAFKIIGGSANSRIDFLINEETKKVYINEINSIPGCLAFYLWQGNGVKYVDVLDEMINIGIAEHKNRTSKIHSFDTNVLQSFSASSSAKMLKG